MASSSSSSASASAMALANFERTNSIIPLSRDKLDSIFAYDSDAQRSMLSLQPWKTDVHFFRKVRISAVALIKMVMHARSGGIYEIMGLMQGKIDVENRTIYVMDCFALPVEGTETRVNAQNEAYEYMVQYLDSCKHVARPENVVGWYHSHPGYGCWLSRIDVNTQRTNQTFQDPFVAIVIDPNRTISSGKVDIGAFRTFPEGHTAEPSSTGADEYKSIPLNKVQDFGVHANQYYPLEIEHFRSSLDTQLLTLLWNKYWQTTLAQNPLVSNRAYTTNQIRDLADQLAQSSTTVTAAAATAAAAFTPRAPSAPAAAKSNSDAEKEKEAEKESPHHLVKDLQTRSQNSALARPNNDAKKLAFQANQGLLANQLKADLFLPS